MVYYWCRQFVLYAIWKLLNTAEIQANGALGIHFAKDDDSFMRTHNEKVQNNYIFGYDPDLATFPASQLDTRSVQHGDATNRILSFCLCGGASSFEIPSSGAKESKSIKLALHKARSKWQRLITTYYGKAGMDIVRFSIWIRKGCSYMSRSWSHYWPISARYFGAFSYLQNLNLGNLCLNEKKPREGLSGMVSHRTK